MIIFYLNCDSKERVGHYLSGEASPFFWGIILCVLLFFVACGEQNKFQTMTTLSGELGLIVPDGNNYVVGKNFVRQVGGHSSQTIEAVFGGKVLKIEKTSGLSRDDAILAMSERMNMVRSLFSNLPSPYPGMVTKKVEVEKELLPQLTSVQIEGVEMPFVILSSNSRHIYGAMAKEMAAFRGGLLFLYDSKNNALYRLDLFVPIEEFDEKDLIAFLSEMSLSDGEPSPVFMAVDHPLEQSNEKSTKVKEGEPSATTDATSGRLNVILIALEPLGANHLSFYGYQKKTAPNLRRFAEESFVFETAISPSSWSLPVFMSWFTSLYPSQHKVVNQYSKYTETEKEIANLATLTPGTTTMTEVLKEHGYHTAAFVGGASLAGKFGFSLGFDRYFDEQDLAGLDLTLPKAEAWLDEHKAEPFFLFVQGYDVHGRYPGNRKMAEPFLDTPYTGKLTGTANEYWRLRTQSLEQAEFTLASEDVDFLESVYDAKIFAADRRLGAFFDKLRNGGYLENSVVIVSSGSGNEYMEHDRLDHGYSLYDEIIRVPLIIRVPSGEKSIIQDQVRTLDIMPTVFDLVGIDVGDQVRKQMKGVSLTPLMRGERLQLDAVSETDYLQHTFKRSLRTADKMKFIINLATEERELFDLGSDPGEKVNRANENPRQVYELEQLLFSYLRKQ